MSGKKQTRAPVSDICGKGMIGNKMTEMKNQRAGNDSCMTPAAALKLPLLYSRLLFQVVIGWGLGDNFLALPVLLRLRRFNQKGTGLLLIRVVSSAI